MHDDRSDLVVVLRLADRGEDAVDHVEGQGVGLSVVEVDDRTWSRRSVVMALMTRSVGQTGRSAMVDAGRSLAGLRGAELAPDVASTRVAP